MTFNIIVLGSSSALPTSTRNTTAQILNIYERFFLLDCGEGTQIQLRKFKVPFSKINHIFISHFHGDHILGLTGLISSYNMLGRKKALNIYGSSELEKYLQAQELLTGRLSFEIVFHKIDNKTKKIYEDNNLIVETFPLKHRIPTNGFVFREKQRLPNIKKECIEKYNIKFSEINKIKQGNDFITGDNKVIKNKELVNVPNKPRSYAFCTDTQYAENIIPHIAGVNFLYHEATFMHDMEHYAKDTKHSTTIQAATIAKKANVENLLIGHYSVRYKNIEKLVNESRTVFKNTYAAQDGLRIEIKKDNSVVLTGFS